ncbi:hypothetical protein [Streptomyces cyaneofuscatus]|uniref:Uncharacterized protein n=1 Tax=Streptomyces cyaneofuscatus TaxID=66883 RepID=A0ABZ1ENV0_9ACTN|nr:hypothetical protein [Streptomyces cyaneofuscatus]WSB05758.1 hypothetical protein OG849_00105 [Streptomyces cyaneofuscatus]WSD50708.1 hypothetical protein OG857_35305 [Streptomyces cyaneofuscatus]
MSAAGAPECFPDSRIQVTVPALDLPAQTAQAWRTAGHRAPTAAVCSLENDPVLKPAGGADHTEPEPARPWGPGGLAVFAAYTSLVDREDPADITRAGEKVRGPPEATPADGDGLYGQHTDPFGPPVVDKAHSTAGELRRPWTATHDNTRIPPVSGSIRPQPRASSPLPAPGRAPASREAQTASMSDAPDGLFGT